MNRLELFDKIRPFTEPGAVCLVTAEKKFGWLFEPGAIVTAIDAWKAGTLPKYTFTASKKKTGESYPVCNPVRMGLVPHVNGQVHFFVIDLDKHEGGADNVSYDAALARFFGVEPIRFKSKSGAGLHQFFFLSTPMPVKDFLAWGKSWGFNRGTQKNPAGNIIAAGRPELFPKSDELTQCWLPNGPNLETGGDCYVS